MVPKILPPSATTSGVPPSLAILSTSFFTSSGILPPLSSTNFSTASEAPLRSFLSSISTPLMRVWALKGMNSAPRAATSRPRMPYCSLASTTMLLPSGVSSASDASWATSARSSLVTPGDGKNSTAILLPRVIVPVLSRRSTSTSPAASTALPDIAITLCLRTRSMPAIPIALRSPPMVVGIRQTASAMRIGTATMALEYLAKASRVEHTSTNITVSPTSRMVSAISLGVFCLLAPSTRPIMWSRKLSPGSADISIFIQSESTVLPPVTELRSPPDSRMTGADSPVITLSSTEATPSITVPSPGTRSPASTSTISPLRRSEALTFTVLPSTSVLATVSLRAFRNDSACALPRPSAIASAKFAKSTVIHNQMAICRLRLKYLVYPVARL